MTLGEAREAAKKALAEADRGIDPADHALVHGAQVHADTVENINEVLSRNAVGADGVRKGGMQAMRPGAGEGLVELIAPIVEQSAFFGGGLGTVAEVVGDAHEGVEGAHGTALRSRQKAEGVIEIARLATGQAFAVGIGIGEGSGHGGAGLCVGMGCQG